MEITLDALATSPQKGSAFNFQTPTGPQFGASKSLDLKLNSEAGNNNSHFTTARGLPPPPLSSTHHDEVLCYS